MSAIGYVTHNSEKGSYKGTLKTLTISCGIEILPNLEKTRDAQPDFRVLTDERTEIGAGWTRTGQSSGGNMSRCPSQRRNSATAACSPISARSQARTTRTCSRSSGTRKADPGRAASASPRRAAQSGPWRNTVGIVHTIVLYLAMAFVLPRSGIWLG